MKTVSLVQCESYEQELLQEKLIQTLVNIGFDLSSLKDARVLVKPNLLTGVPREKAVVTDREFFRAVVKIIAENGGHPVLVESPAAMPLQRVLKKTGYDEIIAENNIDVADLTETMVIHNDEGVRFKRFEVATAASGADIVFNLPKFKTHGITYITGAVKNLFGLIPGLSKAQWHMRAKNKDEFSTFMLDYYGAVIGDLTKGKEVITLMDAVIAMEGKGPGTSGKPRHVGAVLGGRDAVAVDYIATTLAGLDVSQAFTVTRAGERGLGAARMDEIEMKGDPLSAFTIRNFIPVKKSGSDIPLGNFLKNLIVEKPVPSKVRCTLCYQCMEICPAGAITKAKVPGKGSVPVYDYQKCIRCYCCMEICPEAAIGLKRGKLQWLLDLLG
ncbi:MAG TPA: DUF362 domain-containing protein [Spirochaetota bacterium]|nr:DUF362 domain-containing protein [Spirochaetota bacterium]